MIEDWPHWPGCDVVDTEGIPFVSMGKIGNTTQSLGWLREKTTRRAIDL